MAANKKTEFWLFDGAILVKLGSFEDEVACRKYHKKLLAILHCGQWKIITLKEKMDKEQSK
jgi:hypothetical protein